MEADPRDVVMHLRRAVRDGDMPLADALADDIVKHLERGDELEAAGAGSRAPQQDAEPVEGGGEQPGGNRPPNGPEVSDSADKSRGDPWEKAAARAYTEYCGFPKGVELHPEHGAWPMIRAIVGALRARVQPRTVTADAVPRRLFGHNLNVTERSLIAEHINDALGLQIEGEE